MATSTRERGTQQHRYSEGAMRVDSRTDDRGGPTNQTMGEDRDSNGAMRHDLGHSSHGQRPDHHRDGGTEADSDGEATTKENLGDNDDQMVMMTQNTKGGKGKGKGERSREREREREIN